MRDRGRRFVGDAYGTETKAAKYPVHEAFSMIVETAEAMARYFTEAAMVDPLSAILLLIGQLLLAVSIVVFGYLTVRGLIASVTPD